MEKKYVIDVKTPNRIVTVNGKSVRTPFKHIVNEKGISPIKAQLISDAIVFEIKEYVPEVKTVKKVEKVKTSEKKSKVKKSSKKESTLNDILNSDD